MAELPGCLGRGQTADEAVAMVRDAMAGWISVALDDDLVIPEPGGEDRSSGKFLLRIPRGLHAALARAAVLRPLSDQGWLRSAHQGRWLSIMIGAMARCAMPWCLMP